MNETPDIKMIMAITITRGQRCLAKWAHRKSSILDWNSDRQVLFKEVCIQQRTYADNAALPAFACRTPPLQQSIDIACLPGLLQQTCSSGFAVVGQCWDRQTDRRTDTVQVSQTLLRIRREQYQQRTQYVARRSYCYSGPVLQQLLFHV